MHFAYPPRKSSNPPPFRPRSSRLSLLRRSRLRPFLIILTIFLLGWYFLTAQSASGPYREHEPSGSPPGVIVTVVDASLYSSAYLKAVKDNREQYAKRYGYEVYMPKAYDYNTGGYQQSWAKIMAMRHAITKHPEAKFIWYLHQNAFIMDPSKSVEERILAPKQLESMMMKNHPIVPPDSIIKTFESLQGKDAQVVISQDSEGLVSDSVIVRNGDWGKFFTETWLDPLYRSYNFQKAEQHSLEHIVQWHPTILSKIALVPQRAVASYSGLGTTVGQKYLDGDFVVMLNGCEPKGVYSCEKASKPYYAKWQEAFAA